MYVKHQTLTNIWIAEANQGYITETGTWLKFLVAASNKAMIQTLQCKLCNSRSCDTDMEDSQEFSGLWVTNYS